uniref:CAP-Gly domain-containing protein n=1 Tax=Acrobeloides nanus TaxID=290746 RepID=A0A914C636_9BILA
MKKTIEELRGMNLKDLYTEKMNLSIGSRVDVNGHKGKLKYIGTVQGYNGEWIGIDWDDPMRGKHNGTVNGVKYFEARCPTSGSFVRPIYACSGRDLVEEINSRYAEGNVDKSSNDSSENFLAASLPAINIGIKKCEYVGMEKTYLKQW